LSELTEALGKTCRIKPSQEDRDTECRKALFAGKTLMKKDNPTTQIYVNLTQVSLDALGRYESQSCAVDDMYRHINFDEYEII